MAYKSRLSVLISVHAIFFLPKIDLDLLRFIARVTASRDTMTIYSFTRDSCPSLLHDSSVVKALAKIGEPA